MCLPAPPGRSNDLLAFIYPRGYRAAVPPSRKAVPLRLLTETYVPDQRKTELRKRLKRVQGQVSGIGRMLDDNRPCMDILVQITAAQEAIRGFSRVMVLNYLEKCATDALKEGRQEEVYDDLMKVIFKLAR